MTFHAMGHRPHWTTNKKFVRVATNYFSNWIEVESLSRIIGAAVKSFVWKSIIYHFGISLTILTKNGLKSPILKLLISTRSLESVTSPPPRVILKVMGRQKLQTKLSYNAWRKDWRQRVNGQKNCLEFYGHPRLPFARWLEKFHSP